MSYPTPRQPKLSGTEVVALVIAVLVLFSAITLGLGALLSVILGWFGVGLAVWKSTVIVFFFNALFGGVGRRSS
jgi:hypothetical protein